MNLKNVCRVFFGVSAIFVWLVAADCSSAWAAAPKIVVDGVSVDFGKTTPRNIEGFLSAPIRPLTNAIGADMAWNAKAKMAIVKSPGGDKYIVFLMDSKTAVVNGAFVTLDTTPRMLNGTAVAPVKVILQTMGSDYSFDGKSGVLSVTKPSYSNAGQGQAATLPVVEEPVTPVAEVPVVAEETQEEDADKAEDIVTAGAISSGSAVTAPEEAAIPTAQVAEDVVLAGIWQYADGSGFVFVQADFVTAGKVLGKGGEIVGACRGRLDGSKLSLTQWVGGQESTIALQYDKDTKKLKLIENGREVRRFDRIQIWNNTSLKNAMTFNGQWLDIWGNLIVIEVPLNASSNQIITGYFYEGAKQLSEKKIGELRGSVKDGIFNGELIKTDNGVEQKSSFTFSLMENGMFFKGMYAEPGKTEKKFVWDGTRISF